MSTLPTKEERKAAKRKVQCVNGAYVKGYIVILSLECGHIKRINVSAAKYNRGYHGPKTAECYECAEELARKRCNPA
jgi:hypothetical protein